jgi:SAM-dependent methyltransferase
MHKDAMNPFGKALLAYFEGDKNAELILRRDDGQENSVPVGLFFRDQPGFTPIENLAIESCRGHVLDVGAGTGLHSLVLQRKGLSVTAIDIDPEAVRIMKLRGLSDVQCADLFEFRTNLFDTVLMLGHGIGMVEKIAGLDRFLNRAHELVREDGQLLFDSLDVRCTDDASNLAYHEANRKADRYIGEIRMQSEFRGKKSPYFGWLQVDAETLKDHVEATGWRSEVLHRCETGDYLARLVKSSNVTT